MLSGLVGGYRSSCSARQASLLLTRGLKETTGIVGLPVDPQARSTLRSRLMEVLQAVQVIPPDAFYRKQVESTVNHRLKAVDSEGDDATVEAQLQAQLEQLTEMCNDELGLIPQMAEWKPWDVPDGHTVDLRIEELVQSVQPEQVPQHQAKK